MSPPPQAQSFGATISMVSAKLPSRQGQLCAFFAFVDFLQAVFFGLPILGGSNVSKTLKGICHTRILPN